MFPYADDTPSYSIPLWVIILVILNVVFFVLSYSGGEDRFIQTLFSYGCIPARFFQAEDQPLQFEDEVAEMVESAGVNQSDWAAPLLTLFTSIFLHGGIAHIIGNMWFLWLFADNVEDRMGKLLFPIFYIVCGLLAGLLHVVVHPHSTLPAVGASGAIAGVMGAYIYMFPRATIASLITLYLYIRTVHVPAPIYLGLWLGLQLIGGLAGDDATNVAFWAHIGGFAAGLILAVLLSALGLINRFPGDRGYDGSRLPYRKAVQTPRPSRKKRYIWRE
jgi:membrane associated rhomboid family serine protease